MKRIISVILAVYLMLSVSPFTEFLPIAFTGLAAEKGVTSLSVNPYGHAADANDTVYWTVKGESHFLFLPADTKPSSSKLYFKSSGKVYIDGTAVRSGKSAALLFKGQSHTLSCDGKKIDLTVLRSENIPAVYIKIKDHSLSWLEKSKSNKDKADIRIYENGILTVDAKLKQIKGRGNATWTKPKKPYNIKFEDKTNLFGMGEATKYSLLASYSENTLLHNPYAFTFANKLGLYYTSKFKHVDLYINGEYRGNYILCESVEVGEKRVKITDLDKANEKANPGVDLESLPLKGTGKNGAVQSGKVYGSWKWVDIPKQPKNITGGYLMELDYTGRYDEELSGFVTSTGQAVTLKSPECATEGEVKYISDFVDAAFRALKARSGYNKEGKHYSYYFDMDSLVSAYILEEFSKDFDAALSSFYFFKRKDSNKLYCSPVWDFDNAFGSRSYYFGTPVFDTTLWFANELNYNGTPNILNLAYRHDDFRTATAKRYAGLIKDGTFDKVEKGIKKLSKNIRASAVMNAVLWKSYSTRNPSKCEDCVKSSFNTMLDYISKRKQQLSLAFSTNCAWLTYDLNGVSYSNCITSVPIIRKGQSVKLISLYDCGTITPPDDRQYLRGWNTKADGSGTMYKPGQTVSLKKNATVLYAIWGAKPITSKDKAYTPEKVKNLSASASGNDTVNLRWTSVPSASQYRIYIKKSGEEDFRYLGKTTSTTSYTVKGLKAETTYAFSVRSVSNAHGLRLMSPAAVCKAKTKS